MKAPSACIVIIGNEILSGRTQDKNLPWLAKELNECGIRLMETRVIPDIEQTIIDTVNACRGAFDYVFTTGGIGPTHDDITSAAIAKAFGVPYERHKEAEALLLAHYGKDKLNAARLKMAEMPRGATLIDNAVSAAPGFQIGNVYVMAGIPGVMQAMFTTIKHRLRGGDKVLSRSISAYIAEGTIAEGLTSIQARYDDVEIGSYPFVRQGRLGTCLVSRGTDPARLETATSQIRELLQRFTEDIIEDDLAA
jgi:molybdenum cofactor synthesis domain-containing protein